MTKEQAKMCKNLSGGQKALIRERQLRVFKYGKIMMGILATPSLDSITASCRADPMFCLEMIEQGVYP